MTESTPGRQRYAVQDRERTLTFTGVRIGHASSRLGQQSRWAEISIYRTDSGTYIVSGAGRTVVDGETSRCWAHVISEAPGVVAALYQYDDDDVRYLTKVAKHALEEAAQHDEAVQRAFLIEEVA